MLNVAMLVGSLRKESFTRKIGNALIELAPATLRIEPVEIGQLPLYNQDLDTDQPPGAWVEFRERIRSANAVLFATPEYNRSVPGVLKNAIDVGSRPYGQSAFEHKPAAVISVSPGTYGAFGANHHLRQSLVFLDMPCMQRPEVYISHVANVFDEAGKLKDDKIRAMLEKFGIAFAAWVERFAHPQVAHSAA